VFAAFNFIYTHLMMWPSLSSAVPDLELLLRTCQHVASESRQDSASGRDISTLLATMYNAAFSSVSQAQSFLIADRRPHRAGQTLMPLSPETLFQLSGTGPPTQANTYPTSAETFASPFGPRTRFGVG
jgi:hypothetical protein